MHSLKGCDSRIVLLGVLLAFAGQMVAQPGGGPPDPQALRLKIRTFDPLQTIPSHPGLPSVASYAAGVRGGYLVQFRGPIEQTDRAAIEQAGGSVKGYVPMMALEVVMTEEQRAAVANLPGVRWVGVYQPSFKVEASFLQNVSANPGGQLRLQVSMFAGEGTPGAAAVAGLGGQVVRLDTGRSYALAEVLIPASRFNALTQLPLVRFVEPVYERQELNDRSRHHTGLTAIADNLFATGLDPTLDGHSSSGFRVKYGHFDGGMQTTQADFSSAVVTVEPGSTTTGTSTAHGTHTAGSIIGNGSQWSAVPTTPPGSTKADSFLRGITPQAALHHISFSTGFSDQQIITTEADVKADISTNSWGYCNRQGPFCNSITSYNTNSAIWDDGVSTTGLITFFSAGNSGNGNSSGCGTSSGDQIGTPGNAKNVITVGSSETDRGCNANSNNVNEISSFSSRGPVDPDGSGRGLFKPDVVNIGGYHVLSVEATGTGGGGVDAPSSCSDSGSLYRYEAGTSMSTPLTAGLGGALLQDLVSNRGVISPKPSLVKALLINGAKGLNPSSCTYSFNVNQGSIAQGWGMANAVNSLYGPGGTPGARNVQFENEQNAVSTGGTYTMSVGVNSGTPLRVTLAWTDYPAAAGASSPLVVNDLDLEVSGPSGTFRGNNFSGVWSVTGGTADRYNVVENVYIQNPTAGTYTITVRGFQISQDQVPGLAGVNQNFSLAWSGALGAIVEAHDVAVTSVTAPLSALVNTNQLVTVALHNQGTFAETFNVALTSDVSSTITNSPQLVTLAAGATTTISFGWTPNASGTHNLTATAAQVSLETDTSDNSGNATVLVSNPIHDVAVTSINAPSSAPVNTPQSVSVVVGNQGNVSETFSVSLASSASSTISAAQSVTLAPGGSQTLTFSWTPTVTGNHLLTATAGTIAGETDTVDNSQSTTSNVIADSPAPSISSIAPNSLRRGQSASATIVGANFVTGATVAFVNGTGPAPAASNINFVDANNITCTVTVPSGGPARNRVWDLRVTNPDGKSATLAGGFTVTP